MKLKALAFDVDGTLYPYYRMLLLSTFLGIRYPVFVYHFSRVRSKIRKVRPIKNFRDFQAEMLSERLKREKKACQKMIERIIYEKWEKSFKGMKLFPKVKSFIGFFKKNGIKLAVMSDFPVIRKLDLLRIPNIWDCAFSSEETGYLKPNPEPFLRISDVLGIPVHEIMYIGDNYQYDIVGAQKVGMKTAFLNTQNHKKGVADVVFNNYDQLKNVLCEKFFEF